jgi:hypothetical protein
VVRGYTVDIQRTLSLTDEEEARWRLSVWSGDCVFDVDASTEPRGGHCQIVTNDDDKSLYIVNVTFEQRARLRVNQVSSNPLSTRWSVAMSPQLAGGNPLTRAGTFDCNFPQLLPVCSIDAMYDKGTTITLTAGTNPPTPPTNWQGWSGACPAAGKAPVCVLTLTSDVQVTGTWAQDFFSYTPASLFSYAPVPHSELVVRAEAEAREGPPRAQTGT